MADWFSSASGEGADVGALPLALTIHACSVTQETMSRRVVDDILKFDYFVSFGV